ncbi:MAG: efflux RND transporter periplasmic adaptor subunit [Candidatus Azobacteroides sp.]|nr:efflux RND transporter periplasmic adaptor subunit [Candidatus Azobacteroides sp.]
MKKRLFRWLLIPVCFLFSCSGTNKEKEKNVSTILPDEKSQVKAMLLTYSDFHHEIISNGTISSGKKADLYFDGKEIIQRIFVKNGSYVKKGQPLAVLDQFKLKKNLSQAEDNLERARLELQDVLIGQGYSLSDSSNIPSEVMKIAKVRSNYDSNMIQYELAKHALENAVLYAPFDGVVANLFSKEYNLPESSVPFCTLIGQSQLEVEFTVLESELPILKIGDKVMISPFSVVDYTVEGRISEINPVVDKNGMVKIKASVNGTNKGKLYLGMNVKVRIQQYVSHQLVIPKEAVVLRSNRQVVFTLENGKAMWKYVQSGLENSTGYVINEGLHVGDSIIYEGNINLANETPVIVKKEESGK